MACDWPSDWPSESAMMYIYVHIYDLVSNMYEHVLTCVSEWMNVNETRLNMTDDNYENAY